MNSRFAFWQKQISYQYSSQNIKLLLIIIVLVVSFRGLLNLVYVSNNNFSKIRLIFSSRLHWQQNTAMEAKCYQLTMFADRISHDPNVDKDVVLMELSELLQPQGLELALEKCSSTQNGGEITFLGQTFSQTSTSSLAALVDRQDRQMSQSLKVAGKVNATALFLTFKTIAGAQICYN
ncbi:Reverse_transcriptase/endonuclease [Hexamita inflata]|uniref:Reverse transcriptase/endonuclease n=1 Tax=Hexamita inflata TaxID=28002 RepID=A0AA86TZQ0_9EUKA|nr:Reverse transcriptase/endonuclease [Hexamita inflata]